MSSIDPRAFRNALGRFATGVTVVTTVDGQGQRFGVTVNSYSSVSLDPPLVLWSLARTSLSLAAFQASRVFAIHVLGAHQETLAMRFASRGEDKFAGLEIHAGFGGVPLFDDCVAHFECVTEKRHDGGDHVIFIGRVVRFETGDREPLLFHRGSFARVQSGAVQANS